MRLYSCSKNYKLYEGDMRDMLEVIEPNSIDAILTDPPYELNFMNKKWDNTGIAFQKETWKKCYDALKSGGHMLVFGGSRTFHRIACAIEDAGFEIRDTIMWIYGSGMPKSMNISKQIDKRNRDVNITIPSTDFEKWDGWGTQLKPSYESVIIAQKPYDIEMHLFILILDILNEVIEKCQLNLDVNIAEKLFILNQAKRNVEENIVPNNVEKQLTKENLLEVMVMLRSILMENTNLNIDLSCLNFLVDLCEQMNKYTIEMKINLITELKILKSLVVQNISENTINIKQMNVHGIMQNVLTVEKFLKEEKMKLNYMNILFAQENVILKEKENNLHPNLNQIIIARKPCEGSIVDNVMKHGVGGINIDECRVPTEDNVCNHSRSSESAISKGIYGDSTEQETHQTNGQGLGRFPANTILTYDDSDFDEVCGGFPMGKKNGYISKPNQTTNSMIYGKNAYAKEYKPYNDEGSASRYFYCAKASKRDRDEGVNGHNTHCTVKPTSLISYLVRLVTPKGGTVLDPFNGSGSTGKACMYENADRNANYKYVGIELTEEYLPIAKARIEFAEKNPIMDYEIKKTKAETKTETNKIKTDDKSESIFEL